MHDTCVTYTRNASHTHTHAGSTASLFRRFLLSFFGDIFIYPFLSLSLSSVSLLGDTCRNTLYPLRNTRIQEIKKYKERTIQERKSSCNVNVNVKQLHVNHQSSIVYHVQQYKDDFNLCQIMVHSYLDNKLYTIIGIASQFGIVQNKTELNKANYLSINSGSLLRQKCPEVAPACGWLAGVMSIGGSIGGWQR